MEKVLNAATLGQLHGAIEKINDALYKAIYYLDGCIVVSQAEEDRACPLYGGIIAVEIL